MTMDDEQTPALPCVVCGKKLTNVATFMKNQPHGGTTFKTHGHYGSTVFDPMDASNFLELNICDPCLVEAAKRGDVLRGTRETEVNIKLRAWDAKPQ